MWPLATSTWDALEIGAMQDVINSGKFKMGPKVFEFEKKFANYFGSKYAIMSNSGSSANLLAVAAVKISRSPKDRGEVIVPAVSWGTTYFPIDQLGFTLKFVDIDPETLNIDLSKARDAISKETVGIVTVNLLGNPSDVLGLRALADENNLFFIEDNCESMGATLGGRYLGTFGDIGTFSTFFSHHISTMEGGVCVTDSLELAELMISLRAHGWLRDLPSKNTLLSKNGNEFEDSFKFLVPGYNLRPLELSGAVGSHQLDKLPKLLNERRLNSERFISRVQNIRGYKIQQQVGESSWFGFSIILTGHLSGHRQALLERLDEKGIEYRPIVAGNFTIQPVMRHLRHAPLEKYPAADEVSRDGFFIGNHHYSLKVEIETLVEVLTEFSLSHAG